jgi:predicted RNase H-like nuclease (RuvC/YqgF family)
MSEQIEQKKKLAADAEKARQQIIPQEAETREQAGKPALLAAEFRKVASQLGELRRRETHLLRRVAFLKAELEAGSTRVASLKAELEAESTRVASLKAELEAESTRVASLKAELEAERKRADGLEAQVMGLRGSTSWRATRPLRWLAEHVRSSFRSPMA